MAENDVVTIYVSETSPNKEIVAHQNRILSVISGLKIEHKVVDVSANREDLVKMREIVGDEKALAPHIAKGDTYIGNYAQFEDAVEEGNLKGWLGVA